LTPIFKNIFLAGQLGLMQTCLVNVFKCKLTPILKNIILAGQLGLMQTCLDRRAPPPEQKTPPSTWNKNVLPSLVHDKPSHWLHDFIFFKTLGHHF
jgi:hypothetical protein